MLDVLSRLSETAYTLGDLVVAMASTPYGAGHALERRVGELQQIRSWEDAEEHTRRAFQNLSYRLERQGLVTALGEGKSKSLTITNRGMQLFKILRVRARTVPPPPAYITEPSKELKIISFDIPERERWKRRWLRSVLTHLDFTMLQQSVWVGTAKIPRSFLEDLRRHHLLGHVHIFAVTKTGSLNKL